jgi:uncharacterized protein (TIGR03437 family)
MLYGNPISLAALALLTFTCVVPADFQTAGVPTVNGIVTASAFGGFNGAAPGSFIEIYGSSLAGTARGWASGDFSGPNAPASLDGVSVQVGGIAVYVNYVSPGQVNIQVPDGVPNGPADVVVSYQGQAGKAVTLNINTLEPGFYAPANFKVNGRQYVAALHSATGAFVNGGNIPGVPPSPATGGETLILNGTGFGPVEGGADAGKLAPAQTALTNKLTMTIGNSNAAIAYAGLAPGLVGLYQFNIVVPINLPGGGVPPVPTNVVAIAGDGSASLSFNAPPPPPNGGTPNTTYTASCTGGGASFKATGSTSPIAVFGLSNGTT